MKKKNIALIFGGYSTEYYASCVSAANILKNFDEDMFNIIKIGITLKGEWFLTEAKSHEIEDGKKWVECNNKACVVDLTRNSGEIIIFNESSFENNQVSKVLKKLQSHYGKFAVLGDKDQNDSSTCSNILTEAGFEVLHNEVRNIYYKEDVIQLIGLENTGDCSGLINETNEKSYKIALIHQPDYFKEISQYSIQLQLSGHTLGGYYKIPFIGGIETKDKGKNYVNGKHTKNKTTLLISNGFNKESSENHRFLTRDEVNIITLKR